MYGHIDLRLARDTVDRRRMTTSEPDGAASLTLYARIAQTPARAGGLALVRCRLVTGRTHQIRAHLAAKGWPLVGDRVYGEPRRAAVPVHALAETLRAFSRQALHAWRLGLVHPVTRTRLEVEAPVPADLDALMTAIGWRSSILCRVGRALR
jgi:23S rRNA pseudouridine1911/1915/1917 synthase